MLSTSDFNYYLPEELIAQTPVNPRDNSRLMVYDKQNDKVSDLHFYDILNLLKKGDVLVVNNTKVLPARMYSTSSFGLLKFSVEKQ